MEIEEKECIGAKLDSQFTKPVGAKDSKKTGDLFKPKKAISKLHKSKDSHAEKVYNPLHKKTFLEDQDFFGLNGDQSMFLDQKNFFGLEPQFQGFGLPPSAGAPGNYHINYNNYENITQNIFIQGPNQGMMDHHMHHFGPTSSVMMSQQPMTMATPLYVQKPEPYKSRFGPVQQMQYADPGQTDIIDYDKLADMGLQHKNGYLRKGSNNSRMSSIGKRISPAYKQPRPYQTKNFFNQTMNQMVQGKSQLERSFRRQKVPQYF